MRAQSIGRGLFVAALAVLYGTPGISRAQEGEALAAKANTVLKNHCYRCHGQDGALEGGMNFILDREKLIARRKVLPGDAKDSPLYKRMAAGKMPPPGEPNRPTAEDIEIVRRWIDAGAASASPPAVERRVLTEAAVQAMIRDDLETLERRSRRFTRYFSLAHLYNLGLSNDELQTYRNALAKVLNSLSWHPRVTVPKAIDPDGVVLRIDLRDFMWDAVLWNKLITEYPFGVIHDTAASRAAVVGTATRVPVVRADWFIATASRAPLYYELLLIPTSLNELERQLRVDATLNIQQERVARAGFNGSGVSRNNRVLERHDSVHGAYWRTYDFDAVPQNLIERDLLAPDRRNLFAYPLGPGNLESQFQHAGGEVIFNLPNGLHGYMLVNANNERIDKGPTAIVSDPRRPDRAVEAGVSCMSCHIPGIIQKSDQIRNHVAKNPKAFNRNDAEIIRALYPPDEKMRKLMEEDAERYRKALEKTGNQIRATEPVSTLTLRYEADVDLETVAAEMGLRPKDFLARVLRDEVVARNLGGLKVQGGTVSRQVAVQSFGDLVRAMRLGSVLQVGATGQNLPDNTGEVDPLEGASTQINAAVVSPDGRFALLASADKSVRYFDVDAGRDVRRLIGHTASVWSVAFSSDGRRALSGGVDTNVRLWDVRQGAELKRMEGHGGLVLSVAFSPGGNQAVSAALDHGVILWDLETGKEIQRIEGIGRFINVALFSPDGKELLLGGDRSLHLVDLKTGKERRTFEGHTDAVTAATFSPDGKHLASASDDGTVRLWDVGSGRIVRSFTGHESYVKSVAFSADGKWLLTGSTDASVRLWETATGKELRRFGRHSAPILSASFTPDGKATVSASNDADVRLWELEKGRAGGTGTPSTEVKTVEQPEVRELKPSRVLSAGGAVANFHLSPNRKWLYYLNLTDSKLGRLDTSTLKRTEDLALAPGTEALAMSPDGTTLAALAVENGSTRLQVIDAKKWSQRKAFTLASSSFDLAVDDRGRLFVTSARGDWSDVTVLDAASGDMLARWGGVWGRSFVRLSVDQRRLYFSTQGVSPGYIEAYVLPAKLDEKPSGYKSPTSSDLALGGDFLPTPDGRFLIARTGSVLRAEKSEGQGLLPEATVKPFLAGAVDVDNRAVFLCGEDSTLRVYSYPDFKLRGVWRLPGVAYQAACDPEQGRLYLGVLDPKVMASRPRGRDLGEIHVYNVRQLAPVNGKRTD